jgi:hypothetical protein
MYPGGVENLQRPSLFNSEPSFVTSPDSLSISKMQAAGGVLNLPDWLKTSRINSYAAYNGGDNE